MRYEVDEFGDKRWYNSDGQYHREDGPACEYANGDKSWWINNKLHREDGPAVEYASGSKYWWYHGELIEAETLEEFLMEIALR